MSHSRFKRQHPQQQRQHDTSKEWNQSRTSSSSNDPGNYSEQERYGGYGGSQGVYGSQGGYRPVNYADRFGNPRGESEFQGSREYREDPRYGQQGWRSQQSYWEPENRWERETGPQYRESYREDQPNRAYRQWGNDYETDNRYTGMNRMGGMRGMNSMNESWEDGMESQREPERQRNNVTRFGQRGMQQESRNPWNRETTMPGRQSFVGRGPQGYKRSDERITEDINEELTQDPELDAADVNIEVKNGEVVLKGTVPDRESKRRAEEIAECCSGVKDVQNQLRIKRDESSESENMSRRDKSDDKRNKAAS